MNKGYHMGKLLSSLAFTGILIYFMIITTSPKIIFLPFVICGMMMSGKHLALFFNNRKLAEFFSKMFTFGFLLFLFGFLIVASFVCLKNKDYMMLIFTLPFWIAALFVIKRRFFNNTKKNNGSAFTFPIVISSLLVGILFFSGIAMLYFGIKDTYELNWKTKDYITTEGYFDYYDVYDVDEKGVTYKLTYTYSVNGNEYTLTTDYGTNYIPDAGSIREIKYNPNNPSDAVLTGTKSNNVLIYFGAFFTFGSFTFILVALTMMGYFDKFKIDVLGLYVGVLFIVIGAGIILFQTGTTMSLSETIKSFGLLMIIPVMLIVAGLIQTIKCLVKAFQN